MVKVYVKGPEETPNSKVDYQNEKLTGLEPGAEYTINGEKVKAEDDGTIQLKESWIGTTISVVKQGDGKGTTDSAEQIQNLPQRPQALTPMGVDETGPMKKDGKIIDLAPGSTCQISKDHGVTWQDTTVNDDGEIIGLAPGTYLVRTGSNGSNFSSSPVGVEIVASCYKIVFLVDKEIYKTLFVLPMEPLKVIPEVPNRSGHSGEWCDANGKLIDFTSITADMEVYAVYTPYYTVTLHNEKGYTLSEVEGSTSPVKEGGEFTFQFSLEKGYHKTSGFAVRINGEDVELSSENIYTIQNIRQDMTVEAVGVKKKVSSSEKTGPSDNDASKKNSSNDGSNPSVVPENIVASTQQSFMKDAPGAQMQKSEQKEDYDKKTDSQEPKIRLIPEEESQKSEEKRDSKTSDKQLELEENGKLPSSETEEASRKSKREGIYTEGSTITVYSSIQNGKIVSSKSGQAEEASASGGNKADGTIGTDGKMIDTVVLSLEQGAVIVTVRNMNEVSYTAKVTDAVATANAILTEDEIEKAKQGEIVEICVDVEYLEENVPKEDAKLIRQGIKAYKKKLPGLSLGMYVDISVFMRIGGGNWNVVSTTKEPMEIVFDIPDEITECFSNFCVLRAHDGEYMLLNDMDSNPSTITIQTDAFSTYAIAYRQENAAGGGTLCGLCHMCPTFLGVCCYIWMAVILLEAFIILLLAFRKRKNHE